MTPTNSIFQGIAEKLERDRQERIERFLSKWNYNKERRYVFTETHPHLFWSLMDWFDDGEFGCCENCFCFTTNKKCPDCGRSIC